MPIRIVNGLNCTSTSKPDQRLQNQKRHRLFDRHLTRRDRPRARALDLGVEIAVGDVVPGAAGAAHREGADEEQQAMPGIGIGLAGGDRGEPGRPPARQQQQPGADRAVEPRQPQIGPKPGRRGRIDPVAGRIGDAARRSRSSAQRVSGQRVEGAAALLADGVFDRRDRNARGAERIAEAWRARLPAPRRRRRPWCEFRASWRDWPSSPSARRAECGIRSP